MPQLLAAYNAIPAGASNVVVTTDLAREVGGFDPSFGHLADWDLWVRLAAAAPGAACDEPLVGYRLHSQSMRSTAGGAFAELARFDRMHGRPGRVPPGRIWFYRWLADGQLLAGRKARGGCDEPARRPPLPQPRRRDPGGADPAPPGAARRAPRRRLRPSPARSGCGR